MPKPPLNERIKALEDANALLIAKIDRMKAQVKHNQEVIRKMKKREDKQDIEALINEVQAERLRRSEQSQRDKQRSRMTAAATTAAVNWKGDVKREESRIAFGLSRA